MSLDFSPHQPYNALPTLPPRADVESRAVLRAAIAARTAVAELKGASRLIPNPAMLIRALVLQEARQSSEIENVVTTSDELYQALSLEAEASDPHTKEVMRYGDAVWHGMAHLRHGGKISPALCCELCSLILERETLPRSKPGTRIGNSVTGEVVYTPPEGAEAVHGLLANLSDYLGTPSDVDPLIKLAVAHYQFEAIHPFTDGNGRTGRVLNILYLAQSGLLDLPVLYLSRFINEHKGRYYASLRAVTENWEWEEWVLYMLEAVEQSAAEATKRIETIRTLLDDHSDWVRAKLPKIYSRELMEIVFSQPYTRIAFLVRSGVAQRQTATKYLDSLVEAGLLKKSVAWRDSLYLNEALMQALTA